MCQWRQIKKAYFTLLALAKHFSAWLSMALILSYHNHDRILSKAARDIFNPKNSLELYHSVNNLR